MSNATERIKNFLYDYQFDIRAIANDIGMTEEKLEKKLNGKEELSIDEAMKLKKSIKCKELYSLSHYQQTENSKDSQNLEDLSEEELLIQLIDSMIKQTFQKLKIEFKFD